MLLRIGRGILNESDSYKKFEGFRVGKKNLTFLDYGSS
jgi:hypothetical protein